MTEDILERLQRLRDLGVHRGAPGVDRPARPPVEDRRAGIPGEMAGSPFGPAWLSESRFPLSDYPELAYLLDAPPQALAGAGRDPALAALQIGRAAVIDTETTGLSTGTGTYAFLIGIGTFEPDRSAFVVRQYFMRNPAEERAQLHLVEQQLGGCSGLITFNGRAFDVPLLHTRFTLAATPPPWAGAPHLDLLPAARRVWRARLSSCALAELERSVLDVQRTAEDVPGWMIPEIYTNYYKTGQGEEMIARVFYHNLTDITSMATLAARLARLFETTHLEQYMHELPPLDCLSLARCYAALDWIEAGETAYRAALAAARAERGLILRELSFMLKRLERRAEAAELWEEWISSVADGDLTPYIELAKHHEWHTGDLAAARGWTAWAIHIAEGWPPDYERDDALAGLRRRLDRLERKLAGRAADDIQTETD